MQPSSTQVSELQQLWGNNTFCFKPINCGNNLLHSNKQLIDDNQVYRSGPWLPLRLPPCSFLSSNCPYLFSDTSSLFQLCKFQGCCSLCLKCSYHRPFHGCSFTFSGVVFNINFAEGFSLASLLGGPTTTASTCLFFCPFILHHFPS